MRPQAGIAMKQSFKGITLLFCQIQRISEKPPVNKNLPPQLTSLLDDMHTLNVLEETIQQPERKQHIPIYWHFKDRIRMFKNKLGNLYVSNQLNRDNILKVANIPNKHISRIQEDSA